MKRNLSLIIMLLLTTTWLAGQKVPEILQFSGKTEKQRSANLSDFKPKQFIKAASLGEAFYEGFEGEVFPPAGWKLIEGGSPDETWKRHTDNPITGNASASITYSDYAHDDWLITPPLKPVAGCNIFLFKAKQGSGNYPEKFNVKLSTTGNNKEDFTIELASNIGPTGTSPETFIYDLSAYNGQTVYLAIQAISTDMYLLIVDDFAMSPTDLVVTVGNKDYRLIPLCQLDKALIIKTNIENQGNPLTENVNVIATLKNASNTTLFTSTDALTGGIGAGQIKTVSAATPFDATALPVGNYSYTHTADYATDYDPTDNTDIFNFSVTDFIYARDAGIFPEYGIGSNNSKITFGNLFNIVNTATISGVQFVWPGATDDVTASYQLALYKVDDAMNVTETVFTTKTYERDNLQAGQTINIAVSPKTIQPGLYVLAVKQTSSVNIGMAYDQKAQGFICIANDADNPTKFNTNRNFGNVSLRMDFTPRNTVNFTVKEQASSTPIEGASITLKQGETIVETAVSNTEGKAEIYVPVGDYTYSVKKIGYKVKRDIALTISGDKTVDVELETAPPTLEITPATFTFPDTQFKTSSVPQTFTMQNIGTGTIIINESDISITGDDADQFYLYFGYTSVNLSSGKTADFTVMFTPTTIGNKTATVKVNDNLGTIHEIVVKGNSIDLTVTEFPYIVSFDDEMFPPLGWVSSGEKPWERVTTGTFPTCEPFGAGMLKYNCWSYDEYSIGTLTTRRLDMSDGNYAVKFKMYRDNTGVYSGKKDKVDVYAHYQSDITRAQKLGTVYRYTMYEPAVDAEGWYDYSFNIPATVTYNYVTKPTTHIFLVATSMDGTNIYVDEFVVGKTNTVTLIANPSEGGTLTGGGKHIEGVEAKLTATANRGYKFINWTNEANEVVCTTETYNYLVGNSDVTFTANFEKLPVVTFTVVDTENNPIKGATVIAKQGETVVDTSVSNSAGKAMIYAVIGDYNYSVSALGFYPINDIAFTINGDMAIDVQMTEIPPALKITPTAFTFAKTQIATSSAPEVFTMQNTGGGTVTINPSDITITGTDADQFTLINIEKTVNLGADETEYFGVTFTPTAIGNKTATIEVKDNLGTTHKIVIDGSAFDFTVTEFPYKETFDGEEFPPLGWLTLEDDDEPWERVTNGFDPICSPFGTAMLKYNCWNYAEGSQGTLISRRLNMGSETYSVGFKMYRDDDYSDCSDKVDVYINKQANKTGATKLGTIYRNMELTPVVSTTGWYDYAFEVPAAFVGNISYIILQATSNYGSNIYVDELVIGKKCTVTLAANPSTAGTVAGGGTYVEGTEVKLTATPKAGYVFKNWTNAANEIISKAETFYYLVGDSDATLTANFELGHTVTFTVVDDENNSIEGANIEINETSLTTNASGVATIMLADGNYPYTISKLDFATITETAVVSGADLPINITMQAQIYAPFEVAAEVINENQIKVVWNPSFEDDMENYEDFIIENIGNYTLVDVDNTPTYASSSFDFLNQGYTGSYIVFNPSATTPAVTNNQLLPHSGNKYLACFNAIPNFGSSNNDWLITHQITVVPGMRFSFWAKTYDADNGLERFKVAVSTTDTNVDSFTFLTGSRFVEAPLEWTQYTYSLEAFAGQQIYLAINCVSDDAFIFMLDDIYIGGAKVGESATLTGYNIYLDGAQVAANVTTTEYTITNVSGGTHTVGVQSVYGSSTSEVVNAAPITIISSDYTVTFTVTSNGQALEGAEIAVNNQKLTTDASGVATINLANGEYNYTVSKPGYTNFTGSFTVNNDTQTIPVNLTTTGIDKLATDFVRLYPNPVKNKLIVERNNSDKVIIELYNINGLLIGTTETENRTTTINMEALNSGSYFVKIIGTNKTPTVHRFIKQ